MTHHGVELVEGSDDSLDGFNGLALSLCESFDVFFSGGNELVERGIKEADANGAAFKSLVKSLKVALLVRHDLCKSGFSLFNGVGADHLTERRDPFGIEEHVLCTAKTDTLGAQLACLLGIARGVGVCADAHAAVLVSPAHDPSELACDFGINGGDDAVVNVTGRTVDGDIIALVIGLAGESELLVSLVHGYVAAAGNTAGAHTAGNNGSVRGHTAADGQDTLSSFHTGDVLGRGLKSDKNDLLACLFPLLGIVGSKHDLSAGSTGRCAQTLADGVGSLECLGVELRVEQSVEVTGIYHHNGFFFGAHALVNEVAGDLESSLSGSLTVAALKHIELAVLNGELHILHIAVVGLEVVADLDEVGVSLGELFSHLRDRHRSADAGNDVFALSVGQELAHQLLLAGGGVTGKGNACTGVIVEVAEYHGHYVDGSAPAVRNIVVAAVYVRTGVVP